MRDATDEFFADLERHGHEPTLKRLRATLRWDVVDGDHTDHRLVEIVHGDIRVTCRDEPADCVIIAERAVCNDVITGRTSALAALLRGAAAVDGDRELMVLAQRLFRRQRAAAAGPSHPPETGSVDG